MIFSFFEYAPVTNTLNRLGTPMLPNTPIVATGSIALSKAPVAKHSAPDNAITPLLEAANKKEPISNATHKVPGIANNNILQKNNLTLKNEKD